MLSRPYVAVASSATGVETKPLPGGFSLDLRPKTHRSIGLLRRPPASAIRIGFYATTSKPGSAHVTPAALGPGPRPWSRLARESNELATRPGPLSLAAEFPARSPGTGIPPHASNADRAATARRTWHGELEKISSEFASIFSSRWTINWAESADFSGCIDYSR